MTGTLKGLAVVAVSVAAFGTTAVAQDQPTNIAPVQVMQNAVRVSYGDLDLNSARGQDLIRARITRASNVVCAVTEQPLIQQMDRLSCVNSTRRTAFEQLAANRSQAYAQADRALVLPMDERYTR